MLSLAEAPGLNGARIIMMDGIEVGWLQRLTHRAIDQTGQRTSIYMAEMKTRRAGHHKAFYATSEDGAMAQAELYASIPY